MVPGNCRVEFDVKGHDEDVDVEGVDEPDVDHLEVGRLRHQLVDRRLDRGENGHDRDRDHDSILEKGIDMI